MDVSVWWIVAAFFGGGFLGILAAALMYMASEVPKQTTQLPDLDLTRY
jgi:RsiW-degrading membrane proteinase PrsW (M82 family)